jgi:chromosome segregation ATPase
MRSIWSSVKRWVKGLFSSGTKESEKDLRERLDRRIEAEKQKARGVEELRKELRGARSDMSGLKAEVSDLRGEVEAAAEAQQEVLNGTRRLSATLKQKQEDLGKIENIKEAAEALRWRTFVMAAMIGALSGILSALMTGLILWQFGAWTL